MHARLVPVSCTALTFALALVAARAWAGSSAAPLGEQIDLPPALSIQAETTGKVADARRLLDGKADRAQVERRLRSFGMNDNRISGGVTLEILPDRPGLLGEIRPILHADGRVSLRLRFQARALTNSGIATEAVRTMEGIAPRNYFNGPKHFENTSEWFESSINARLGSSRARKEQDAWRHDFVTGGDPLRTLAATRDAEALSTDESVEHKALLRAYLDARGVVLSAAAQRSKHAADTELATRETRWSRRRAKLQARPQARLDQLVAAGDRPGVRRLFAAHIPWEVMDPLERLHFRSWLDALEKPDPNHRVLTFRGLSYTHDLDVHDAAGGKWFVAGGLAREASGSLAALSDLHASHPRASAPLSFDEGKNEPVKAPHLLNSTFSRHSGWWNHTPFMSSSNLGTASTFGRNQLAALSIDARRVFPNPHSGGSDEGSHYSSEQESLIPMVVFPDEVVHFEHGGINWRQFGEQVEKKVGRSLTDAERHGTDDMKFNALGGQEFFRRSFTLLRRAPLPSVPRGAGRR